jgi:hypothetical protein
VPKLRKGGYIPFFVTERKRSELALATEREILSSGRDGYSTSVNALNVFCACLAI